MNLLGQKGAYDTLLGQEGKAKKRQGVVPRHPLKGKRYGCIIVKQF